MYIQYHQNDYLLARLQLNMMLLYHRRWNGGIVDSPRCLSIRLKTTRFPELFEKTIGLIPSFLAFTLMGWVSWPLYIFVFLASFSALWWPNIWPKMGFPELFEKTFGSIHFIPDICRYGVSFLTPVHFRVPSLIFGPLVAKYLAENGVSGIFEKTIGSIHFIPGIYPYGVSLLTPIHVRVPSLIFLKNSHLCSTWLQNRNLYWIFLDEMGSD